MAKQQGRCIFCGGYGLSLEHVFPDWLRKIFPRAHTDTHTEGDTVYMFVPARGYVPLAANRKKRQGQSGTRKVRVVCRKCNNGWLSTLEEGMKPILTSLIFDTPLTLLPSGQRSLATWIAKTVMTGEFIKRNDISITQTEREVFRSTLQPAQHWNIWLAPYVGGKWSACGMFHNGVGIYLPPEPIRVGVKNTHWTVIGIGQIAMLAAASTAHGITFEFEDETRGDFTRIWPATGRPIAWPTRLHLTDAGVDETARRFSHWLGLEPPQLA